jgi:hypothetical protein
MKTRYAKGIIVIGALLALCMGLLAAAPDTKAKETKKPGKKTVDLSGEWKGTYTRAGTTLAVTMDLLHKGESVTGTVIVADGTLDIDKGTFNSKERTLVLEVGPDASQRYTVSGKVDGDTIRGSWNGSAENGSFEVKRAASSNGKSDK